MRCRFWLILALAVLSGCAASTEPRTRQVAADATEGTFSLTAYDWDGKVAPGETVHIVNRFGDLRVRAAIEGRVVVSGAIQRFAGDDGDIDVEVTRTDDGLRIEVIEKRLPAERATSGTARGSNRQFDGRIDMALLLPHAALLHAETADGRLQLKSYEGPATLESISGNIAAATPSAVVARSHSGNLDIRYSGSSWSRDCALETGSGAIMVEVAADADVRIEALTRGDLTARLGVPVTRSGNSLSATVGNGAHRLSARSETGEITLRRYGID